MGVLLIALIGGALFAFDIITAEIYLLFIVGSLLWMCVGAGLYIKFGFLKFFYHDFLGWHTPGNSPQRYDGCSEHAVCKDCGKNIMQDSQGNWF